MNMNMNSVWYKDIWYKKIMENIQTGVCLVKDGLHFEGDLAGDLIKCLFK